MMMLNLSLNGQEQGFPDTVRIPFYPPRDGRFVLPLRTSSSFRTEGSFSAGLFTLNNDPVRNDAGYFFTSENIMVQWSVERPGTYAVTTTLTHRLGAEWWIDSTAVISLDENSLKCHFEWKPFTFAGISVDSELSSRLFNDFGPNRERCASLLTPIIWNLASGISFRFSGIYILAGINGLRMISLADKKSSSADYCRSLYSIPENKCFTIDYGLHLQVRIDKMILKSLRWNMEFLGFINASQPPGFSLRNLVEFQWNKILVTSLNTHISYDYRLGSKRKLENRLTVGLAFRMIR
jgi:hypothetical protein